MNYIYVFFLEIIGYADYLKREILYPQWNSYFYWLLATSLFFWFLESLTPWRKNQAIVRKDFWLDAFYMFFNFFLFSLIGFSGVSKVGVLLVHDVFSFFGVKNLVALEINQLHPFLAILILFVVNDFLKFNVHRLLHALPRLWSFHKLHHSVQEMGFAAHFRFHWMEIVIYKSLIYIPMTILGFDLIDFFYAHLIAIIIGHYSHSNVNIKIGFFKYLINNPQLHIWHHAKNTPSINGVNFGVSLSLWDYIFKTNYLENDGKNESLGFENLEAYPHDFLNQLKEPFTTKTSRE